MLGLLLPWLAAACGNDDGSGTTDSASGSGSGTEEAACVTIGDPDAADSTVQVTMKEFEITTSGDATAGSVAFDADNQGTLPHELVVVKADSIEELPTADDGSMAEDELADGQFIGEIEQFPAGESCAGAFDLEAGSYVLVCNLPGHFESGMATVIDVG